MNNKLLFNYLLTIAIPTYNGEKTIRDMMDILLPQIDERVEVIVSDNSSTDTTPEILQNYKKKYSFLKITRTEKNIGGDGNMLRCMSMAKGKYTLLLSDDDIFIENTLKKLLDFLQNSPEMGLVYLTTGNFRGKYTSPTECQLPRKIAKKNLCINSKHTFMKYAQYYWGFISSSIINTNKFKSLSNIEQYKGTYWLQCYVYILCAMGDDTKLGIFADHCIGAGVYMNLTLLDTAKIDGINYRNMLNFAIDHGFDKKQLNHWYIQRICMLASHGIIKEKAYGKTIMDKKTLFYCTYRYVLAWIRIYPCFLIPKFVCKEIMGFYRKHKGAEFKLDIQRSGDNIEYR